MSSIPLSLRRKVVIALDADHVSPVTDADTGESRYLSFKTVAWCKANLLRAHQDHVFLITSLDTHAFDGGVLSAMWTSLNSTEDPHLSRAKEAETSLRRLAEALHAVGVSCTIEVLRGTPSETIPEYVHLHKGEMLAVQVVGRSALSEALSFGWPELCARAAGCPTVMIKMGDLPENIASALDP
ncbi:hypothetical protein IWW37_000294 [Coemansia sp. RSA 2050]|nr:hypothetical protein IWW37_000294 [Coemansia sp. RSA 2050]KAJ2732190.1 hypothetical protein IW152_003973 [Coemansia sp. BCRC 34962]